MNRGRTEIPSCASRPRARGLQGPKKGEGARDRVRGFEQPRSLIGSGLKLHFKVSRLLEQCHSSIEAPMETMDFTHKRVYHILLSILDPLITEPVDENAEDET